jgi:hypothetical protein
MVTSFDPAIPWLDPSAFGRAQIVIPPMCGERPAP